MAKCKLCGKSGLFLSVNKDGYCKDCAEYFERKKLEEEKKQERMQKEAEQINALPKCDIILSDTPRKRKRDYPDPAFSNITPKGKFLDFVVFDTETTGLAPNRDRIIEIAAIKFVEGLPAEVFHTYINPGKPIPEEATKINKITDSDVADSPAIGDIISAFDDFIGDNILVAHNLDFDLKFIYHSGSELIENGNCKFIDTLEQARKIVKKSDVVDYTLGSLCHYYNISTAGEHSALFDAYATGKLFLHLILEKQDTLPNPVFELLK